MEPRLEKLATRYWDVQMAADPVYATVLGDHRFDDRLPDLSAAAERALAAELRAIAAEAKELDASGLGLTDRNTRAMLMTQAMADADVLDLRMPEFTLTPMQASPAAALLQDVPLATLPLPEHARALLERYARVDRYMAQAAERLREGVAAQRTPPTIAVTQVIAQVDGYLATPEEADPLQSQDAPPGWDEASRWRDDRARLVRDVVRPALQRYRDVLADEILPAGRPEDRSGVCWLDGGDEIYARCSRAHTTLDVAPDEVHRIGLDALAALDDEYAEVGARVFGATDRSVIFERLLGDPAFRYASADEIVADAEAAITRADEAMPRWFGRLASTACAVKAMTPAEAAAGILAFYIPPATDGSRAGAYHINTSDPHNTTRYEAEAVAFHEALPGHHFQIALAQELDLPEFRRQAETTGYTEGWGLYSERLADEMGLYSDDAQRLGMLSADSLRSARLVVDTGLHALGWSRQRAIDTMVQWTPAPAPPSTAEVDRYIALPGQALGYKLGQRTFLRLRRDAEAALTQRFDIRAFHDMVLAEGAVTLDVLEQMTTEWVAAQEAA